MKSFYLAYSKSVVIWLRVVAKLETGIWPQAVAKLDIRTKRKALEIGRQKEQEEQKSQRENLKKNGKAEKGSGKGVSPVI